MTATAMYTSVGEQWWLYHSHPLHVSPTAPFGSVWPPGSRMKESVQSQRYSPT